MIQTLLQNLIKCPSVTPEDAGCQTYIIQYLETLGFHCRELNNPPVSNLFADWGGTGPLLLFAGHTDVVPVGDAAGWHTDPFVLHERDGLFYGRGTADMKGSLAAMMFAAARFVKMYPSASGRLGFLITSGEEGDDFDLGTPYVMEQLKQQGIHPSYCVVGEPSSTERVGDVIKIGRRGSLTAHIHLHGKQGHVAYPQHASNPIHTLAPLLLELTTWHWDEGNAHFPPTSFQVTHIQSGGHAGNIIPGELTLHCNIRFSTEHSEASLKKTIEACFNKHHLSPEIQWRLNGNPFLTDQGHLLTSVIDSIRQYTKKSPDLSTAGGTSDGRFIAPYRVEVVELGPVNATIHQINECVSRQDLEVLSEIYFGVCERLLT